MVLVSVGLGSVPSVTDVVAAVVAGVEGGVACVGDSGVVSAGGVPEVVTGTTGEGVGKADGAAVEGRCVGRFVGWGVGSKLGAMVGEAVVGAWVHRQSPKMA